MNQFEAMHTLLEFPDTEESMPVLFVGHGSPTNAIEDGEFSRAWQDIAANLPRPKAILCISAHWETVGTRVTAMERPRTIHDFGGFPQELFDLQYPAPGSPALAQLVRQTVTGAAIDADFDWGLDHGCWSVLHRMFPRADLPVIQLSLDRTRDAEFHYRLGGELRPLRNKGILTLASGNIVHNLQRMVWQDCAYDWAVEFDEMIKQKILSGDHRAIVNHPVDLSVPTNEHFLPLLYALAMQGKTDSIRFFAEKVTLGSMSMRSVLIG